MICEEQKAENTPKAESRKNSPIIWEDLHLSAIDCHRPGKSQKGGTNRVHFRPGEKKGVFWGRFLGKEIIELSAADWRKRYLCVCVCFFFY